MRIVVKSRIPEVKQRTQKALQQRLTEAAGNFRAHLKDVLESGLLPINADTGALSESLYITTPRGSDYDLRLGRAMAEYLSGASRWRDAVREHVSPDAYTAKHFLERVAPESVLEMRGRSAAVSVGTMLAWGAWWELGHSNVFTGNDEPARAWLQQTAEEWAQEHLKGYFRDLLPDR